VRCLSASAACGASSFHFENTRLWKSNTAVATWRRSHAAQEHSDWPTYPQLYVDGELLGGADIVLEMAADGELKKVSPFALNPKCADARAVPSRILSRIQVVQRWRDQSI